MTAYTIIGYKPEGGHIIEPVESTDHAKDIAEANSVNRFFLIPEREGNDHLGYLLREDGEYEKVWLADVFQSLCPNTLKVVGRG